MILRQILSLGVIGGILSLGGFVFYRRSDMNLAVWTGRPMVMLAITLTGIALILAIGLATPIEADDIASVYYGLLILWGGLQILVGGLAHFYDPNEITRRQETPSQNFLVRKIGLAHIGIGAVLLTVGATQDGALAALLLELVWGWGMAVLCMIRAFRGFDEDKIEPLPNDNATEGVAMQDRSANLRLYDFYFDCAVPFVFLILYICGLA